MCDVNCIPAIQNPGQFSKIPWILPNFKSIQSIFETLGCKNGVLEYQVKMEDTNYDEKILGRRTRVRMNESHKVMMQYLKALQKTLDF